MRVLKVMRSFTSLDLNEKRMTQLAADSGLASRKLGSVRPVMWREWLPNRSESLEAVFARRTRLAGPERTPPADATTGYR
jgi:hypothetical protein